MRILLAAFVVVALSGTTERSAAETYWPWCAELSDADGLQTNCGFVSYAQCMDTVRGVGGYCHENLLDRPRKVEPSRPPRKKTHPRR